LWLNKVIAKIIEELKQGKLFGHPIHSMLVHFPSALFPMSLIFDVLALFLHDASLASAAFYMLAAGSAGGFASIIFGAMDYYRLPASHVAWSKASLHGLLNIIWICLFTVVLGMRMKQYPFFQIASPAELIISTISVLGLIFSNFLGGDLVFKHKLGFHEEESNS
jgi:uncharacterized membrane protein